MIVTRLLEWPVRAVPGVSGAINIPDANINWLFRQTVEAHSSWQTHRHFISNRYILEVYFLWCVSWVILVLSGISLFSLKMSPRCSATQLFWVVTFHFSPTIFNLRSSITPYDKAVLCRLITFFLVPHALAVFDPSSVKMYEAGTRTTVSQLLWSRVASDRPVCSLHYISWYSILATDGNSNIRSNIALFLRQLITSVTYPAFTSSRFVRPYLGTPSSTTISTVLPLVQIMQPM